MNTNYLCLKKITILLFVIFIAINLFSQAPNAFNYQAVLRDGSGNIRANAPVTVRIDILEETIDGLEAAYAESFSVTTNAFGLINIQIGNGTPILFTFNSINWRYGPYFIKVSVDGTEMGTTQLLSVPYALYAIQAASSMSGDYNNLTNKPVILNKSLFTTAVGESVLQSNTTGIRNTAVGYNSLNKNTSGGYNTAVGNYSLYNNTSGYFNTAIGSYALEANTIGQRNIGIGCYALISNIYGSDNIAIGVDALRLNSKGNNNIAIGNSAMYDNDSGKFNIATGYNALTYNKYGNDNIAYGHAALYTNTNGSNNIAIGSNTLYSNTTGYGNTGVGARTLADNSTGRWNTAVGDSALEKVNGDKNTAIGYKALNACTSRENVAVGAQALYSNTTGFENVAIGARSIYLCNGDANTAIGFNAMATNNKGKLNTAIGCYTSVAEDIYNATAIGNGASVNASHKVVIGNAEATTIGGFGAWTNYSDRRLKENIVYTNNLGLNFITRLKPASYNYIKDTNKRRRDGLIAQDVEQTLKDLGLDFSGLVADDDKDKTLNLSYVEFVVPIITAIQEQQKIIMELKKELDELKKKMDM